MTDGGDRQPWQVTSSTRNEITSAAIVQRRARTARRCVVRHSRSPGTRGCERVRRSRGTVVVGDGGGQAADAGPVLKGVGQSAVDRREVEVALGHAAAIVSAPAAADSGGEILQGERLEARLGGIVRDQFGAIACDGRLALRIQCRRDHEQAAIVIVAALEHRGDEQLLTPELFDRRVAQGGCVGIAEDAGGARQCVVAGPAG